MAITRAQQYQQLVNKPADGKRPGYRGPGEYQGGRSSSSKSSSSKSSSKSSNTNTGGGGGGNRRESYITNYSSKGIVKGGGKKVGVDKDGSPIYEDSRPSKEVRDRQRTNYQNQFTSKGIAPPGPNRKARQRALNFLNRNMSRYLDRFGSYYDPSKFSVTKTGYPNFGFPNIYDLIDEELGARKDIRDILKTGNRITGEFKGGIPYTELNPIPDLDIDSIRELAATQTTMQGAPLTGYQADALEDLRGAINRRDNLLETGDTSNVYPKPPEPAPDDDPMDPCKGPNPPAYCFVNNEESETPPPPIDPRFFRFMADGGMTNDAPMMQGGITDLALRDEFFLGGVVKGIKKGLKGVTRAVKKVAKSPIGKAALLAGVAGIPFGGGSFFGQGSLFGKASGLLKSQGLKDFFLKNADKGFSLGNLSTAGIVTPLLAAPFIGELLGLNKQDEQVVDAGPGVDFNAQQYYRLAADGGLMRLGFDTAGAVMSKEDMEKLSNDPLYKGFKKMYGVSPDMAKENKSYKDKFEQFEQLFKKGYQEGGDVEPVAKKTMPLIDMGGKEKDYRETGGFVDMGRMERADDVPARLSKNEFVFTADAVRNAGDGDVDKGAEVMYNMMKNLESGGDVSEESQGLDGARKMFQTSQRLGEVI